MWHLLPFKLLWEVVLAVMASCRVSSVEGVQVPLAAKLWLSNLQRSGLSSLWLLTMQLELRAWSNIKLWLAFLLQALHCLVIQT
jgi:hypothetical protein